MQNKKTILWDWNGTLLDDTRICIDAINILLKERGKNEINESIYRNIFTFPVRDYYARAGFDFDEEAFEKPALEFIEYYEKMIRKAMLYYDVRETLSAFRDSGYHQIILSAMQQDFLNTLVTRHKIEHFFSHISGIDNHYAAGKVENARRLLAKLEGMTGEICLVGDTIHDYEVGHKLGIRVVLVSRGHQSEERLKKTGCEVVKNLSEVRKLL